MSKVFVSLARPCGCKAWFIFDLVGNPDDRFSRDKPYITSFDLIVYLIVSL